MGSGNMCMLACMCKTVFWMGFGTARMWVRSYMGSASSCMCNWMGFRR